MAESIYVTHEVDFNIHYTENRNHWLVSDHYHNDMEIILVIAGKLQITINGKVYVAEPDTLIFINNLEPHYYSILEYPYTRHVAIFKQNYLGLLANEPMLTSIFNYRPKNFNHLIKLTPDQAVDIKDMFNQMQSEYERAQPYWERSIKALLSQLLIYTYRISQMSFPLSNLSQKTNNKLIIDIQNHIDEHFMEEVNLKDLADMFHTSMYYLCHQFKEITGNTFKNYLIQRRISCAKDLLSYTDRDIADISSVVGFSGVSHFIRTFKKMVNVTPHQYRKKFRKGAGQHEHDKES